MSVIRWGIIGVGDVTEVKSGPAFQKAEGSALVAVMRRDRAKAEDYARRHGVPRVHATADALIADPDVDAVYIATPPSSHCDLALRVAAASKPCLVEKPMAMNHVECVRMVDAFAAAGQPLWVAYYRRAQPRFLRIRELLSAGRLGRLTHVHARVTQLLATGETTRDWHFDPAISGGGLIFDVGSHAIDLIDFYCGPVTSVQARSLNTGGTYAPDDLTVATFGFAGPIAASGVFNFNAFEKTDSLTFSGSDGELATPIFGDDDIVIRRKDGIERIAIARPAHVHQPLIQTIVDEIGRAHV